MTAAPVVAGAGGWRSPLTADVLVADGIRFGGIGLDREETYWVEGRAAEGGRNVLVRRDACGRIGDVTPAPFDVRSRVHEYGGGAFLAAGGTVWFVNDADQRLYRQARGEAPAALTRTRERRYADLALDARRERLVCVAEEGGAGAVEPANFLIGVDLATGREERLAGGRAFYSNPRPSPDGARIAWLCWDHPNMPWDGTELWIGDLTDAGAIGRSRRVAGGVAESVFQPEWGADGGLYFVADPDGWWNLYRFDRGQRAALAAMPREFGRPQWQFGMTTYGLDRAGRIVAAGCESGRWHLFGIDPVTGARRRIETPFQDIESIRVSGGRAVFIGSGPSRAAAVVELDLASGGFRILKESAATALGDAYLSTPVPLDFATSDGETAHAFFYPPRNQDYARPPAERPPLLVVGHGGPTGAASPGLNLAIQFWTSRGFAVADVNYRGSTGYGRAYRERLRGRWGVADVADCVQVARYLSETGEVDGARLAIRGGSAGGYTALAALTFHDTFTAGASYYGIGELEALARDTHKFESRYLERLIGPYPEQRARYFERSPIHFVDRLACPVIFFQGLEDRVVPPNQAEMMVAALRERGLPVAYLAFPGEQHGFRAAATIKRCLEAELYFYGRIFGFEPADAIEPVAIENL